MKLQVFVFRFEKPIGKLANTVFTNTLYIYENQNGLLSVIFSVIINKLREIIFNIIYVINEK